MKIIAKWFFTALALLIADWIVPGIHVASFYTALIVALVLGIINLVIRPIIILFTLPINVLTLGLFTLVINGILFWFISTFIKGFNVAGFIPAFFGALIVSIVSFIGNRFLEGIEHAE